jgi:hypothetical protein
VLHRDIFTPIASFCGQVTMFRGLVIKLSGPGASSSLPPRLLPTTHRSETLKYVSAAVSRQRKSNSTKSRGYQLRAIRAATRLFEVIDQYREKFHQSGHLHDMSGSTYSDVARLEEFLWASVGTGNTRSLRAILGH